MKRFVKIRDTYIRADHIVSVRQRTHRTGDPDCIVTDVTGSEHVFEGRVGDLFVLIAGRAEFG